MGARAEVRMPGEGVTSSQKLVIWENLYPGVPMTAEKVSCAADHAATWIAGTGAASVSHYDGGNA